MAIIFLDIDGVLATNLQFQMNKQKFQDKHAWADELRVPYPFDPGCVKILNEIIETTDAEIVLSSDWKLHWNILELHEIFHHNGVIKSPRTVTLNVTAEEFDLEQERAYQISEFIKKFKPKQYVIIDDLEVGYKMETLEGQDRYVKTRDREGLKQTGVKEKILEKIGKIVLED
jgi:hypothetical protein